MKRILVVFLVLTLGVLMIAPVSFAIASAGIDSTNGVYCEINEVKLFALSAEDCEKAGGVVTHTVTTMVKPVEAVGDNPNEEPEIQRTKGKKPVAP
jgi:hypothetical protein